MTEDEKKLDEEVSKFLILLSKEKEKEDPVYEYASKLPKFMCDNSIGKIAKHMRMLGKF